MALGLVAVVITWLFVSGRHVGSGLFDRSTKVATSTKVIIDLGYQWHPDGTLFCTTLSRQGTGTLRFDPATGSISKIPSFKSKGTGTNASTGDDAGLISPNGLWRLGALDTLFEVQRIDGTGSRVVAHNTARSAKNGIALYNRLVAWMPDSQHWVDLADNGGQGFVRIHAVDSDAVRTIWIGRTSGYRTLAGVTHDERAVICQRGAGGLTIILAPIRPRGKVTRYSDCAPEGMNPGDPVLDPGGVRLAWLAEEQETNVLSQVATYALDIVRRRDPRRRLGFWTSSVEGTGWQSVGSELLDWRDASELRHLEWMPDGRLLSYVYKEKLFTIPAESGAGAIEH